MCHDGEHVAAARSTLLTSPLSQLGLAVRLVYFAAAPYAIVRCAAIFPVAGVLVNLAIALAVFLVGEAAHGWAERSWLLKRVLGRSLQFEMYYRLHPPRPFAYYVFYPLLFPYWLWQREARQEFWLFKGYNVVGVALLLITNLYQFATLWQPTLTWGDFLPVLGITLAVEAVLVLSLLMPLVTTVVAFHQSGRSGRLIVLLVVAVVSTGVSMHRLAERRDPIVSFSTRARVAIRTRQAKEPAHQARLAALRTALPTLLAQPGVVEGDGKVEGPPLDRAREVLQRFYREDETMAFDLWASPRRRPRTLVLYTEGRPGRPALWTAIDAQTHEIIDPKLLPKGAFAAMRHAASE